MRPFLRTNWRTFEADGTGSAPPPPATASGSSASQPESGRRSSAEIVSDAMSGQVADLRAQVAAVRAELTAANVAREAAEAAAVQARTDGAAAVAEVGRTHAIRSAAVTAGLVDLDCLALADLSGVTVDASGALIGADAAFAALKSAKPYLFPATPAGRPSGGVTSTSHSAATPPAAAPGAVDIRTASADEWRASRARLVPGYRPH